MKRTLAVVGILAVLGVAYLVVSSSNETSQVRSPWKIPAAESPAKIVVERSNPSGEGRETLSVERAGETWSITSPIEGNLAPHVATKLESIFARPIEMDDIELSSADLAQYGLDEASRKEVKIIVPNGEPITFVAGDGMRVDSTDVRRTYVLGPKGAVYRARTDLGIILAQPVSRLRDKGIFSLDETEIDLIRIDAPEETYEFVLGPMGEWELTEPQPPFELERPLIRSMVKGLASFRVSRFLEGGREANAFGEPTHIVTMGTRQGDRVIEIKRIEQGGNKTPTYLAAFQREDDVFELMPSLGGIVTGGRNVIRNKLTRDLGRGGLKRIELAGDAGVVLEDRDGEWLQVEPIAGTTRPKELSKFVGNLEKLNVIRYGDVSRAEAGLDPASEPSRVVVTEQDGTRHVLLLGKGHGDGNLYWAAWEDGEDVFLLPTYLYDRLHPTADELVLSET